MGPFDIAREASLLAQVRSNRAGERRDGLQVLVDAYRRPLFDLCFQLTRNREDAEDALQEAFLSVHRDLGSFRGDSRLSTWLYRVTMRAALRVKARRPPLAEEFTSAVADSAQLAHSPQEMLDARLTSHRLNRAFHRLPAESRTVLSLFAVEGLSHAEIADVLGVPQGTVWSRLHTARMRLSAEMERGVRTTHSR